MFEHHRQPLIPGRAFIRRLVRFTAVAMFIIVISWSVGILGYKYIEGMTWVDATLNAAMILGGMGPVDRMHTDSGKLFASFYALFSGIVFLVSFGVLLAPVIHRFFHKFHFQSGKNAKS